MSVDNPNPSPSAVKTQARWPKIIGLAVGGTLLLFSWWC